MSKHSDEEIESVHESAYGFCVKYFVRYKNGSTEWVYHYLKAFESFEDNNGRLPSA